VDRHDEANACVSTLCEVPKNGNEGTPESTAVFVIICTSYLLNTVEGACVGA
jgi:hypothetical protein